MICARCGTTNSETAVFCSNCGESLADGSTPPASLPPDNHYFVIGADGAEYGPTTLAGLIQWVREGRVLGPTLVRTPGEAPRPAETVRELAGLFGAAAANASPPIDTVVPLPAEFRSWDFIGLAWDIVKPHWIPLAAIFFIVTAIGVVPYVGGFIMFIVGGAIYVGINRAILGMLAGRAPTVGMMFDGFDRFGQAFLAHLFVGLLAGIGLVLCIVPGVILLLMWMFFSLILAETDLDFWPAMQASADLTAGYRWQLLGLMLANFLIILLGLMACCVGIFVAEPVVFTSIALAYRFLQARQAQAGATA
jgi:uncharacterized membrane protein